MNLSDFRGSPAGAQTEQPVEANGSDGTASLLLTETSPRRGRGLRRVFAMLAVVLIVGFLMLVLGGVLGAREGLLDRAALAAEHYQRGVNYVTAGNRALAMAEFDFVLRLQPSHSPARYALQQLSHATSTPQPTATVAATPASPTRAPDLPDVLLSEAQTFYDAKQWAQAIERLERLRVSNPSFQASAVNVLLFKSYYNNGLDFVAANRLAEGTRQFENALAIRPNDKAALEQKQLAVAYLQAIGYWQANWQKAVAAFSEIYKLRSNYLDVETRLVNAALAYGDALAERGAWCDALAQYTIALDVSPSSTVRTAHERATARCDGAPDSISTGTVTGTITTTETLPVLATPQVVPANALTGGYIYFSTLSSDSNRYLLSRVAAAPGARPEVVAENVRQPAISPNASRLAVRNMAGSEVGLATINLKGDMLRRVTTFAEDAMPTWSPDGQEWIFASNREGDRRWRLYHAWAEGTEATEFVIFGSNPAWFPGKDIAYQGCDEQGNRCGLWQMSPNRSAFSPLTDVPGDTSPAWAPGGSKLAFMSAERSGNWDIFVRETKSGRIVPVAPNPAIDAHPTWSPDGKWVAFLSNRDGAWAIFVVQPGGGPTKIITLPGTLPDWPDEQITWGG